MVISKNETDKKSPNHFLNDVSGNPLYSKLKDHLSSVNQDYLVNASTIEQLCIEFKEHLESCGKTLQNDDYISNEQLHSKLT